MITIKNKAELDAMRECGDIMKSVLKNYDEPLKSEIVQKISDFLTFTERIFFDHTFASD